MKTLFKYFLSVRRDLKIILAISFFVYFLIELVLIRFPELFQGGYEMGRFFSSLSISYISAFIFYFIVVHIKTQKDKENINEWVGHKVFSIITEADSFVQPFMQIANKKASIRDLKESDLHSLLKSIKRTDRQAPYIINDRRATWLEYYESSKTSTEKNLKEIYVRYSHLDSELIKLLTRIENSMFFRQWNILYSNEGDESFSLYHFQIKTYLRLIEDLELYANKYLSKYRLRNSDFMGARKSDFLS